MAVPYIVLFSALFLFAVFSIKKPSFCSVDSLNLYLNRIEATDNIKESLTYLSLWNYRQEKGLWVRSNHSTLLRLLLLMSEDIESCPGPSIKCMACKKTIRKNQSRIQCERCLNICHLKCFDQEGKEAVEHLSPPCLNANYEPDPFEQDLSEGDTLHELPELRELVSQRGLKILHQNIRGLVSHEHNIWLTSQTFIFLLLVKHTCQQLMTQYFKLQAILSSVNVVNLGREEGLMCIFPHLHRFKGVLILKWTVLSVFGLKFYSPTARVFELALFIDHQTRQDITQKISKLNLNRPFQP